MHARVTRGDPAQSLLDYIDNCAIDMVIMGRRGIGRIGGIVVGSVSSKVSAHAHSAVLTVK